MAPVRPRIRVQPEPFNAAAEIDAVASAGGDLGAVVTFTGHCRDEGGTLAALELEHYPGMAERELEKVATEALGRWPLLAVTVIHRFGRITPGEGIVLVVTASAHRQAAFDAAAFLMDYLKSRAPFWKREIGVDGRPRGWVAAKSSDDEALRQWDTPPPNP